VVRATGQGLSHEYFLKDHLGSTRVVFNGNGAVLQATDYYAFGLEHTPLAISNTNRYLYNGKELQDEPFAGGVKLGWYDYGARFYDPTIARWVTVDPLAHKPKNLPISPYAYTANNPISRIDPDGRDWFYYKAKGEEKKTWHWQEGNKTTYTNAKGKQVTTRNGYDYLVTYQHTGKNLFGAATGTITVYNQNQVAFKQSGVFSGSGSWATLQDPRKGGFDPAGQGNYMLHLGRRGVMPNNQKVANGVTNPAPNYGIQQIPEGTNIVYPDGSTHSVNTDYGAGRIRMNPVNDNMQYDASRDRGYYIHGKDQWWNFRTHGCVCDKTDNTFNYFWSGEGSNIRTDVPMALDVPVIVP